MLRHVTCPEWKHIYNQGNFGNVAHRNPFRLAEYPSRRSGTGCFIATAAYGTPLAEEIDVLRNWRDECLLGSRLGRIFVDAYYSLSPLIADSIRKSESRALVTRKLIDPFVKILMARYQE